MCLCVCLGDGRLLLYYFHGHAKLDIVLKEEHFRRESGKFPREEELAPRD